MDLQNKLIMAFGTVDQRRSLTSIGGESLQMFPEAPVRQWVLTFPFRLRFLLAAGSSLDQIQAASIHYRIAIGPHASGSSPGQALRARP